ncbi:MAG: DUF4249 family protein [Bacteroidota bacterium]
MFIPGTNTISKRAKASFFLVPFFIMLIMLTSCEDFFLSEAENIDIPGSEPQLAVFSFISPQDSLIKVYAEWSRPYSQHPSQDETLGGDADVYIAKKGEDFVPLTWDSELKAFTVLGSVFPVEAGFEYVLKVESHTGVQVEAECFVPGFEVAGVEIGQPEIGNDEYGDRVIRYDWLVAAPGDGKERYFRSATTLYSCTNWNNNPDEPYCYNNPIWLERGNELFQDDTGDSYAFRAEYWGYFDMGGDNPGNPNDLEQTDSIFVHVLQTDYNYYRFHQSVENYYYHDDDFPFSEAVHIYSNVDGGLGTFGGFNGMKYLVIASVQEK